MGHGSWDINSWKTFSSTRVSGKNASGIYTSQGMNPVFDPMNVIRESRDSEDHPNSTPIILGLDVTGSMSRILEVMAEKIGLVMGEIYKRNPVSDPQILFAAIGDAMCDQVPLQVTQFESDIRIAEQLTSIFFERGGGGNGFESYPLAWHFAANHTRCDNFEKRGKKGYLFTFGDDGFPNLLTKRELRSIFGDFTADDIPVAEVLAQVNRKYEIWHFCMEQGGSYRESDLVQWQTLLGERAVRVKDYQTIPELIVSILEIQNGKNKDEVISSWDHSTSIAVKEAIMGLSVNQPSSGTLVEF